MVRLRFAVVCLLLLPFLAAPLISQDNCPALVIPKVVPGTNIFNPEQEVWLGDAQAAGLEQSLKIISDPALTEHLQRTVDRLGQGLPQNSYKFRVKLIDLPTADAFGLAGGRIYVSRKIVAVANNQDELAGLLAHEMGHVVAHHKAIQTSELFRQILGVTQVTSQEDVTNRWNQALNNWHREKLNSLAAGDEQAEEREQTQADTIALYLVSRAGYSPQALVNFFDRMAGTKGNTGGFWSDFFKTTTPDAKRLRQLLASKASMPPSCVAVRTDVASDFDQWKKSVVEYSLADGSRQQSLPGLQNKLVLTERLRPAIEHIRISPNGKYVVAQDDNNIFVLTRDPLKAVFRFDAPDAAPAHFSPDSNSILVLFAQVGESPRVERWDIGSQRRTEAHEIYVRAGCAVSALSPDGKTLVCMTPDETAATVDLVFYDTTSTTSFWQKKNWTWSYYLRSALITAAFEGQHLLEALIPIAFSPDGNFVVVHMRDNTVCMNLQTRSTCELPASIRSLLPFQFTFLPDGSFMGISGKGDKSEIVEFPSGRMIRDDLATGISTLSPVAHGGHVLLRPIKDNPLGVFDINQNRIVVASKINAMDLWDDTYIAERDDGDLQIFQLGPSITPLASAKLPDANLGAVHTAALSPDLNWLAVSQSSRGAIWNLRTGQRLYHFRGFSGAYFSSDGQLYADFPKHMKTDRMIGRAALNSPNVQSQRTIDEKERSVETGRYLLSVRSLNEKEPFTGGEVMELRQVSDNVLVWSKQFAHGGVRFFSNAGANSLVVIWDSSLAEHDLAKSDSQASAKLAAFKDKKGIELIQIFDLSTGQLRQDVAVDTGKYSFWVRTATATTDRLIIVDNQNRVLVYSFDGQLKGTIAGHSPEVSAKADLLTVRTESGELELYDLSNLQKRATYDFGTRVAFNGFSDDGKRLLVLTADQVVYWLDPAAKEGNSAIATK